ncbi:MAG: hypothetical protein EXR98_08140 [Gemmataceae bacterium]|nr:hypothetical protein [Gemmataceae bacterium]
MKKLLIAFLLGLAIYVPHEALGCTIPVFRYALEKWDLTPYDILVYNRGPLPADLQKTLKAWSDAPNKANIDISIIDLDGKLTKLQQKLWDRWGKKDKGPWMMVRSQSNNASDIPAFSGPCTEANLNTNLDSPMRQAILAHLTRGASVVYVILLSGDEDHDREVFDMATKELRFLEKKIKLPEQSKDGPQLKLPLPLKVSLPLLVLNRNDPAEAAFVQQLLATEDDLDKKKGPILFPIFGRGRSLGSLYEDNLTPKMVSAATEFLCKECSCQVKDLNPGVDLLMVAHWNAHFDAMFDGKEPVPMLKLMPTKLPYPDVKPAPTPKDKEIPPAATDTQKEAKNDTPSPSQNEPAPVVSASCEPPCWCPASNPRMLLWIATGLAGGLVIGTGSWLAFSLRK